MESSRDVAELHQYRVPGNFSSYKAPIALSLYPKEIWCYKKNLLTQKSAETSTEDDSGPMLSKDEAYAIKPWRDSKPYVGFSPTTPQKEAGCLMEPVEGTKKT
jgi:hypothetical protein|tara:strand:+ start:1920 stop:2228 length:309 start_codon:yes stop_codon:yes gene_type:complete